MPGQNAVPLIVLSAAREPVEAVNGILRRAGQPAHCTWIPALRDLADARSQLGTVLHRSNDAIIQVQEGIVVDANPAWLELYGVAEGVSGEPVMDLFDDSTHAALRGALAACLQGRWKADHPLRVNAQLADGSVLPIEITLAR